MTDFAALSPKELREHRETVLLRLLIRTSQAETGEVISRLRSAGHASIQPSYIRLLGNVDTEGTRVVTIARRMGATRQAVSQLIKVIEAAGFLERTQGSTRRPCRRARRALQLGLQGVNYRPIPRERTPWTSH